MTRLKSVLIATLAAATLSAPVNAAPVLAGDSINVPYNSQFARIHYWCAAGDAVIRAGLPVTTILSGIAATSRCGPRDVVRTVGTYQWSV